jgi:hypothetical protein
MIFSTPSLGFGAGQQPADVLAVTVDQQHAPWRSHGQGLESDLAAYHATPVTEARNTTGANTAATSEASDE